MALPCFSPVSASVKVLMKVNDVGNPKRTAAFAGIMTTCIQWSYVLTGGQCTSVFGNGIT